MASFLLSSFELDEVDWCTYGVLPLDGFVYGIHQRDNLDNTCVLGVSLWASVDHVDQLWHLFWDGLRLWTLPIEARHEYYELASGIVSDHVEGQTYPLVPNPSVLQPSCVGHGNLDTSSHKEKSARVDRQYRIIGINQKRSTSWWWTFCLDIPISFFRREIFTKRLPVQFIK